MSLQAKSFKLLGVFLLTVPVLTGCWDRLELEERAVVLGISIDSAEPESEQEEDEVSHLREKFPAPKKKMIRITAQIAIPGQIPLGPGEGESGGGGGSGGGGQSVWVLEVVGHTIDDAIMNLQQQVSGKIFLGHLRVIVISEEVARQGIENLNDYLRRNSEVRRMAWLMISKGSAEEIMMAVPRLERVPTLYLIGTLDDAVRMGKFPENYIGMFWGHSSAKGHEGFLPYVELKEKNNIEISGMAYFRGDKMVGTTKPLEIGAYMATKGLNPGGYRGMISLDEEGSTVTLHVTSRKSKFDVEIKNNLPYITVTSFMEMNVEEKLGEDFLIDSAEVIQLIRTEFEQSSTKLQESLIKQTQEKKSDIYGFGEYVRAKEPQFWDKHVQTKERWQDMYKEIEIDVKVHAEVRRIGMKAK